MSTGSENTDREDGDLHHVFMPTARGAWCHLCRQPLGSYMHVPFTILESFRRVLPALIDEARQ